jgi:hypothetical protein
VKGSLQNEIISQAYFYESVGGTPALGWKHLRARGCGTTDDHRPDTDRYQHVEGEEKEEDDGGRRLQHGFQCVHLQIEDH